MSDRHKTLFPDTNYFLHYPSLQQTDWLGISDAESVLICVCMQVIHELDDKKDDPRLKERAKRAIKEIREIHNNGNHVRSNVTLQIFPEDIPADQFRPGLNPENDDDKILQCVLSHRESTPHEEVHVVSEDLGMEIKCEKFKIPFLKPDEKKRLPDLGDTLTKKFRQTQQELDKHRNALPDLTLSFRNEEEELNSRFYISLPLIPVINVEEEMATLRRQHPFRDPNEVQSQTRISPLLSSFFGKISEQEYERYNRELEKYFKKHAEYLNFSEEWRQFQERSFRAFFILINNGYSPASAIDVHIHFPDGMDVFDPNKLPPNLKERNPPKLPREPLNQIERMFNLEPDYPSPISSLLRNPYASLETEEWNVSSPRIEKSSSYEVHYEVGKLKHRYSCDLGELLVVFPSKGDAKSFAVDFTVTAENHPDAKQGQLHFIFSLIYQWQRGYIGVTWIHWGQAFVLTLLVPGVDLRA